MALQKRNHGAPPLNLKLIVGEKHGRWPTLDLLKGVAVVMMLIFHFAYDLKSFLPYGAVNLSWLPASFWFYLPRLTGGTFLFVFGYSCWLKRNMHSPGQDPSFLGFARAALKLGVIALTITFATTLFMPPSKIIYFGILHCLAVTKILLFPFLRFRFLNLAIAFATIALGPVMKSQAVATRWLLPVGIPSTLGTGGDWYALIPWAATAFLGVFAASLLGNNAPMAVSAVTHTRATRALIWLGKRSLAIYLLHQPLLIGAIKAAHFLLQRW